eukprot:3581063-Alexandrium_andersonii.AAC.1
MTIENLQDPIPQCLHDPQSNMSKSLPLPQDSPDVCAKCAQNERCKRGWWPQSIPMTSEGMPHNPCH